MIFCNIFALILEPYNHTKATACEYKFLKAIRRLCDKYKIILIIIFTLFINVTRANTLFDSLNSAYLNNPKLNAERASLRASKEEKKESISEFFPSVTISGYVSEQDNTQGNE